MTIFNNTWLLIDHLIRPIARMGKQITRFVDHILRVIPCSPQLVKRYKAHLIKDEQQVTTLKDESGEVAFELLMTPTLWHLLSNHISQSHEQRFYVESESENVSLLCLELSVNKRIKDFYLLGKPI